MTLTKEPEVNVKEIPNWLPDLSEYKSYDEAETRLLEANSTAAWASWNVSDVCAALVLRFGRGAVADIARAIGKSHEYIRQLVLISLIWSPEERYLDHERAPELSLFRQAATGAGLSLDDVLAGEDTSEARHWLKVAVENEYSVARLRREMFGNGLGFRRGLAETIEIADGMTHEDIIRAMHLLIDDFAANFVDISLAALKKVTLQINLLGDFDGDENGLEN